MNIKRALISVYDKTDLIDFVKGLKQLNIEIISSGGTASHLKKNDLKITKVSELTGFPEMLDGRVKTLHPIIHAGILAKRNNIEHIKTLKKHNIKPIDLIFGKKEYTIRNNPIAKISREIVISIGSPIEVK